VFQVVISEQTFKTGQLTFLARRVFPSPMDADGQRGGPRAPIGGSPLGPSPSKISTLPKDPSVKTTIETTNTTSAKENEYANSTLAKTPTYVESVSTPPPEAVLVADGKNLAEEKEVPLGAHEDTGFVSI
jgi:hypothetical protein